MGRLPVVRRLMVLAAVVLGALGPAASANRAQTGEAPYLQVVLGGASSPPRLEVATAPAAGLPSRIELDVPAGYAIGASAARGTTVGFVSVAVQNATGNGGGVGFANIELAADDPAAYATDPVAQACAPGTHSAVWAGKSSLATQTLRLLVFVDAAQAGGQTLLLCPSGVDGTAEVATRLDLVFATSVQTPSAQGTFIWRALVAPRNGSTYELRAVSLLPTSVTLNASYDPKLRQAVLTGRATAGGRALAHASISFEVRVGRTASSSSDDEVTTGTDGRYSLRLAIKKSSDYVAYVETAPEACTPPPSAPGGCLSQTIVPPEPGFATVFVAGRLGAKRAYTRDGQSRAAGEQLRLADLPAGSVTLGPGNHICDDTHPSEAKLTVTGEAQSPLYGSGVDRSGSSSPEILEASATVRVYRSPADAKAALAAEGRIAVARCLLDRETGVASTTTGAFPQRPATVRAFLDRIDLLGPTGTLEVVFVQRGRSLARLVVFGLGRESRPVTLDLVQKLGARLR